MIKTIQKHQMAMSALAISRDGEVCLYGGGRPTSNQDLYIGTFDDPSKPTKLVSHTRPVTFASFLPNGSVLSVSWDRETKISHPDGEPVSVRNADSPSRYPSYALTNDCSKLVFGSKKGSLEILSLDDFAMVSSFRVNERGWQLWSLATHPKKNHMLVGSASGEYGCWDLEAEAPIWSHQLGTGNHIHGASWSPEGQHCVIACATDGAAAEDEVSRLLFLNAKDGKMKQSVEFGGPQPRCCAYSDNGNLVAVGFGRSDTGGNPTRKNCLVMIVDARNHTIVHRFEGHTDVVQSVAFRPSQPEVISVSFDGSLRRWKYA